MILNNNRIKTLRYKIVEQSMIREFQNYSYGTLELKPYVYSWMGYSLAGYLMDSKINLNTFLEWYCKADTTHSTLLRKLGRNNTATSRITCHHSWSRTRKQHFHNHWHFSCSTEEKQICLAGWKKILCKKNQTSYIMLIMWRNNLSIFEIMNKNRSWSFYDTLHKLKQMRDVSQVFPVT